MRAAVSPIASNPSSQWTERPVSSERRRKRADRETAIRVDERRLRIANDMVAIGQVVAGHAPAVRGRSNAPTCPPTPSSVSVPYAREAFVRSGAFPEDDERHRPVPAELKAQMAPVGALPDGAKVPVLQQRQLPRDPSPTTTARTPRSPAPMRHSPRCRRRARHRAGRRCERGRRPRRSPTRRSVGRRAQWPFRASVAPSRHPILLHPVLASLASPAQPRPAASWAAARRGKRGRALPAPMAASWPALKPDSSRSHAMAPSTSAREKAG